MLQYNNVVFSIHSAHDFMSYDRSSLRKHATIQVHIDLFFFHPARCHNVTAVFHATHKAHPTNKQGQQVNTTYIMCRSTLMFLDVLVAIGELSIL